MNHDIVRSPYSNLWSMKSLIHRTLQYNFLIICSMQGISASIIYLCHQNKASHMYFCKSCHGDTPTYFSDNAPDKRSHIKNILHCMIHNLKYQNRFNREWCILSISRYNLRKSHQGKTQCTFLRTDKSSNIVYSSQEKNKRCTYLSKLRTLTHRPSNKIQGNTQPSNHSIAKMAESNLVCNSYKLNNQSTRGTSQSKLSILSYLFPTKKHRFLADK